MRICSGAGCLRAVPDGVQFCDECKPVVAVVQDEAKTHSTAYDEELHGLAKSGRWQRLSRSVIRSQPMCAICDRRISELTDHIVPARVAIMQAQMSGRYTGERWAGYFLRSNLQGLCRPCHWIKTNEEKQHTGDWPDVVEKERLTPKKQWSF